MIQMLLSYLKDINFADHFRLMTILYCIKKIQASLSMQYQSHDNYYGFKVAK